MSAPTPRRRAPGMSPEQRREMIIRTALPLVAEFGTTVTTAKIARAAGIGEATIFRVFADKDELLAACVAEAARPDQVLGELSAAGAEDCLERRLEAAADAVLAHLGRMGAVMGALQATGYGAGCAPGEDGPRERDGAIGAIVDAVARLLEPDRDRLRSAPAEAAEFFFALLFGLARPGGATDASAQAVADMLLHGLLADGEREKEPRA
ncbi:TetR/AcrR family transcriptional regulator [Streptomyces sp. NPDC002640]